MNAPTAVQLCLLRHAHAGDPMKWAGPDDFRPLTEKGRRQSERLGMLLAGTDFRPDAILSSPKTRALETARLVAAALEVRVDIAETLGGPLSVGTLDELLRAAGNPARPMLVGHDPDFSMLAAELTGLADLPMRKAALVRIDLPLPLQPGTGTLRWLLPPDLLSREG